MTFCRKFITKLLYADRYGVSKLSPSALEKRREVVTHDFLHSRIDLAQVKSGDIVFFRSLVRDDYKEMFHAIINASGISSPVIIEDYICRQKPATLNIAASRFMLKSQDLYDLIEETDGLTRAILFVRLCLYGFILEHFREVRPRAVIFFADMQPTEHLLAWYFRKQGVTTVTMQHGLYVDYGGFDTVNTINYLHQPSEYFLSWGPETSELIARHHPGTKIVECGKPLIFNADPPAECTKADRPYVAILLDQKPFHQQNEEMIDIVRAHALRKGLDVRVRFHPSLPKQEILKKYQGIREQLHFTDAAFVVGHTSSMIYEAISLGCRVMRYITDVPAVSLPSSCEFSTLAELESGLAVPQQKDLSPRYFTAIGNDAVLKYRQFFDALLRGVPPKISV